MAEAVQEIFPEAKFGIGPAIENGFYYDFDLPRSLTPEDLTEIEERMREHQNKNASRSSARTSPATRRWRSSPTTPTRSS